MTGKLRDMVRRPSRFSMQTLMIQLLHLIVSPIIYSMLIPLILLDACIFLYEHICFRVYNISIVPRKDYFVIDRHQLSYLNGIQKINCVYCGYANGLAAYTKEIIARTEEYWCPIKHDTQVQDPHSKYDSFLAYGDRKGFQKHSEEVKHLKFKQ